MKFSLRHQSSGKAYPYIEPLAHFMVRGFFRKIHLSNRKGVPTDKPVLLAVNHPTAFLDPCLLCVFLDPPLYNMTRGDVFKKKFYRKLMESVNMFPVFRMRDGYSGRNRNDEVFEFCEKQLVQNRVMTIYVEGEHHLEKYVRPVQKGIMRIAFDTFENQELPDLQIIPAGCNYAWGDRPRDEVMINIGQPIFVRDFWADYQDNPIQARIALGELIEKALKELCFHIDDPEDTDLVEHLLEMDRSSFPEFQIPIVVFNAKRFVREKKICDRVNVLDAATKLQLKQQCSAYFAALKKAGLTDAALANPDWGAWHRLLFYLAGFLPFLLGHITSLPVIGFARYITKKTVRKREFLSSVWMGAGFIGGLLYYFIWIAGAFISWNPWWIALALALPVLGWWSMFYKENWRDWLAARKALGSPMRAQLLSMRKAVEI